MVDRIIHHLVPILAGCLRPDPNRHHGPWIIDGTLIPCTTSRSPRHPRTTDTQIIICAHARRVVAVGRCRRGNRNDVVIARHTLAHLLTAEHVVLGDGGYRGIGTITTPRRNHTGRTIRDQHWRAHRRIRPRVEHVIAQGDLHRCGTLRA